MPSSSSLCRAAAARHCCFMETWCRVQLCIYLFAGISLMLFLCTGSCVHSSSLSSEAQSCNQDFSSNNSTTSSFCSCKRFIMESYHGEYGSLLDSDFQDFIARGLPSGLCGMLPDDLPRLSVLQQNLIGEGSHRLLSSSIRLNIEPKSLTKLPTHSCEVILIERLPIGVFADPFELQHLLQRGVFNNIAVFGDTNLELPSFLSNHSVVEVHMDVGPNLLISHKNGPYINIALPLHARYPPLDASGYSRVKFGAPDVFMCCSIEGNSPNQSCLFSPTGDGAELGSGEIVWRIPAGRKTHAEVVSIVTFISAIVSTLFIVLASIFYSKAIPYKTLKQS
ncbi:phosphatidylinositol-glycan biosynthesis class X protein [Carya illinoinensis]|uniref:Phosphatidylinositol-glycan biosynthesis class X protein n=2 Tax=Carya illinoinensis TaxID=32201 RepID=A0A8T1P5S2_CARIL|nr:phosphatidylinositol-glycan biosynthesis class X protein [Carya illinoinensis]KAG6636230.1 hypothetical protein CIPAW_11G096900 [Carya illinoinensis]